MMTILIEIYTFSYILPYSHTSILRLENDILYTLVYSDIQDMERDSRDFLAFLDYKYFD